MKDNKDFERHQGNDRQGPGQDPSHLSGEFKSSQEKTIPVIEETAEIEKKWVESGKVHIAKKVSEHNESIDIPITHEEVNVERVEVNQFVDSLPPSVRYEGDTMIIPVLKEVMVKRVMIVEELRVTKKEVQKQERQHVTLRTEEVNVERTSASSNDPEKGSK